ncbi:MAG: 5-(carboxyamino)imidazole ribonucleotide synthase [Nevskia sp.]|nr:5-(carboxyamino)imidazole ribonucleotide synthase [Nevskia sp.]
MKIGILGAGQLGRMLALAGYPLGLEFTFLDPAEEACAAPLGEHIRADYLDQAALAQFCAGIDLATYEFENVPQQAADFVAARVPLLPGPQALSAGQDRLGEKQLFVTLGIPVPEFAAVSSRAGLEAAVRHTGLPAVLKTRRMGYDGKGQFVLRSAADLDAAWAALGAQPLILEAFVPFKREVSCLAVRGRDGAIRYYPLVENVHRSGILRTARPRAHDPLQALGEDYARRVLERLDYVGVLAFEFFVVGDGAQAGLLANEIAPRVHNSGHWSIEGAEVSQFENHLRAIAGLPLGSTALRGESLMLNFIGSAPDTPLLAQHEGLHIHLYGKTPKPQRKIGHATLTAADSTTLEQRLRRLEPLLDDADA